MSVYYSLVCIRCKEQLPVFRNGMYFDANPDNLISFIKEHQSHGIVLLDEHKTDSLCVEGNIPVEWRG